MTLMMAVTETIVFLTVGMKVKYTLRLPVNSSLLCLTQFQVGIYIARSMCLCFIMITFRCTKKTTKVAYPLVCWVSLERDKNPLNRSNPKRKKHAQRKVRSISHHSVIIMVTSVVEYCYHYYCYKGRHQLSLPPMLPQREENNCR